VFGVAVALPLLAPIIVIWGSSGLAWLARELGSPVSGRLGNVGGLNHTVTGGAFGPLGAVTLVAAPVATIWLYVRRRADARQLALALALPLFLVLLTTAKYNWYLTRFLLVPAVLCAPLLARLLTSRAAIAAYLAVGATVAVLVLTRNPQHPWDSAFGSPWVLTQVQALELSDRPAAGRALQEYDRLVPARGCVGAVLDPNSPAFILSGPSLGHRVEYLNVGHAVEEAYAMSLSYVVITRGVNGWAAAAFRAAGWKERPLAGYWTLAVAPRIVASDCD
jgi:hypothetical protein